MQAGASTPARGSQGTGSFPVGVVMRWVRAVPHLHINNPLRAALVAVVPVACVVGDALVPAGVHNMVFWSFCFNLLDLLPDEGFEAFITTVSLVNTVRGFI